ncbi:Avr3b-L3 [Phytophthora nicotianae]|uniref:Histone-lysine N-methyltransferase, H3 lysine-79 specific n=1 Tax=Phytophthora nicotianae TaxID=4792 RepID=A0A0W8CB81_PHYNI|nr:Avr3b-L3 [Phytophthora nicotianae]
MTVRRRPANRRGRRSAEHLKLSSPHLLSPRSGPDTPSSTSSVDMPGFPSTPREETSQQLQDVMKTEEISSDEAMSAAAAVIESVMLTLETGNTSDTSTTTSCSSDGETTAMLQHAQQLQRKKMQCTQDDKEENSSTPQELRRSRRKRRTVDVLSPSQDVSSGRKSPHKRRNVEKSKVAALVSARPAVAATAAARAEAAMKETKRRQAAAKKRAAAKTKVETPEGVLSPVQDEKKKTPKTKRSRKARRSLESAYSFDAQTEYVSKLIAELYEEQEQDDREMYSITRETVLTETSTCTQSQEVKELSLEEFRRLMTYGEVSVESVASIVLPLFNLDADDVFFDLGCGTGKILVQAALQTPCKRAIGIELMQNRVLEGHKALNRLKERDLAVLQGKEIEIFRGDIFVPPEEARLMDATVVFINNVMFGPQLMLKVLQLLKEMPKLRCVMTLRKICERHGHEKCSRAGNYCIEYVQPPVEQEIDVSWADKASIYFYESLDFKLKQLTQELAKGGRRPIW